MHRFTSLFLAFSLDFDHESNTLVFSIHLGLRTCEEPEHCGFPPFKSIDHACIIQIAAKLRDQSLVGEVGELVTKCEWPESKRKRIVRETHY